MEVSWPGDYGEIHTRILERMKQVLEEETEYPYLKENAAQRLAAARILAKNTKLTQKAIVSLGGITKCWFPWLGTRSFRTLVRYLKINAESLGISNVSYDRCNYICFRLDRGSEEDFIRRIRKMIEKDGICCDELLFSGETPIYDKYDPYIPSDLLRKAYARDRLRADEAEARILSIAINS